ncbi:EAL domain-containing protein [Hydrogenimonas sp.]
MNVEQETIEKILEEIDELHRKSPLMEKYRLNFRYGDILAKMKAFLLKLAASPPDTREIAETLTAYAIDHAVPFAIISDDLQLIRERLVAKLPHRAAETERYFKELINQMAHQFLLRAVKRTREIDKEIFQEKLLYQIHYRWQRSVHTAILADDPDLFPSTEAAACPFKKALEYPEAQMICHALNICGLMEQTHEKIHELTSYLIYLMAKRHYSAAYMIFKELKSQSEHLLNILGVLFYNAQIDRRKTFLDYIGHLIDHTASFTLGILDIQSMKQVNKYYGPQMGDMVIKTVQNVLEKIYQRFQDNMIYVQGIGGDFYLYFKQADEEFLKNFVEEFKREMERGKETFPPLPEFSTLFGFVAIPPSFTLPRHELLSLFSYLKSQLRPDLSYLHLDPKTASGVMKEWIENHYRHMSQIRKMLEEEKIEIFLQPITRIQNRQNIHAFEVLARIRQNDRYIAAGSFIDNLIELNLVAKLDKLVLERIVHHREKLRLITSKLFINVSATTLADPEYIQNLIEAIRGPLVGIEIIIELTEQVVLDNLSLLSRLSDNYGLIFAIDDFGTGYSSLQTVIKLAEDGVVQYLKFDGSLAADIEVSDSTRRIVDIAAKMSHTLGLESVIECIENENQRREFENLGLDFAQGYFYGYPESVDSWYVRICRKNGEK